MARRTELFALSVIVAGLALSALARLPAEPAPPGAAIEARTRPQRTRAAASDAALQALLDARPLDLNRARAADFELLPGVGPALAQRIVEHRAAHGAFADVDALAQVRGIGPKTLARLRPLVAVGATVSDRTPRADPR